MSEHHPTLSPSSFPMLEKCPLYRSGPASEAAESGTRQHQLLAHLLTVSEDAPAEETFGCDEVEREQVEWACEYIKTRTSHNRQIEKRLALVSDDFEEVTFGTLDVVDVVNQADGDVLKVFDYKSGEDHGYRPQMAVYARMAMLTYGKTRCEVCELYGRKRFAKEYPLNFADTGFVLNIINRVQSPEAVPCLNEFCSWCEKHGTCAAATEPIMKVATEYEPDHPTAKLPLNEVATWHASEITDPWQMSTVLQVAEFVGKWADAVKEHARKAALGGMSIPGYILKNGRRDRVFTDLNVAYEVSGLSMSEFLSCCKASVSQVEKAVAKKHGHKSAGAKAAKEDFDKVMGNFYVYKENAPTLARA